MIVRAVLITGIWLACSAWLSAAHAEERFAARLDTVPIDTRTRATVTGNGHVSAELDGDELVIEGTFEGLSGAATGAWLHVGAATGARGPQAHELKVSPAVSGKVDGTIRLNRRERDALGSGRLYIQIHSQAAPEGNLWGWLLVQE